MLAKVVAGVVTVVVMAAVTEAVAVAALVEVAVVEAASGEDGKNNSEPLEPLVARLSHLGDLL